MNGWHCVPLQPAVIQLCIPVAPRRHWRQVDSFAKADAPALVGGLASSLPPEQALQQLVQAMPLQALQHFLAVRALSLGEGDGVAAEHGCCQAESCHPWQAAEQVGLGL